MPHWVDSWLLPARCGACGTGTGGALLCVPCTADLPWNREACPGCALPQAGGARCPACLARPRAFDRACVPLRYESSVRRSVLGLKYASRFIEARQLIEATLPAFGAAADIDLILPVPLHPSRQWRRGYNQSAELARRLGQRLQRPVALDLAQRLRRTDDQIGKSAQQRRDNLRGAFSVGGAVAGLRVALMDDVMTTGATLDALAQAARDAGAIQVSAWALARQPLGPG